MRVVFVMPGSGSRSYCQNCLRDESIVTALRKAGHEVHPAPFYLPITVLDEGDHPPVFYGAVNIYLKEAIPSFRRAPAWVTKVLDSGPVLSLAESMSGSTSVSGLEGLTLSMLEGDEGPFAVELRRFIDWLRAVRPDIVHISNALLLGVVPAIKRTTGAAVLCSLQDEHTWVDKMDAVSQERAWELMRSHAQRVDRFLPVSRYYAGFMAERLKTPRERMTVVYPAVGAEAGLGAAPPSARDVHRPSIGFLSAVSEDTGFDILIDAFVGLRRAGGDARLRVAGDRGVGASGLIRDAGRRLRSAGLEKDVDLINPAGPAERSRFLADLTVLTVPARVPEAVGLFLLEAMVHGVPVCQPASGGYSEVVQTTGGGITYSPNTASALSTALAGMLSDPYGTAARGRNGARVVSEQFGLGRMAERLTVAYETALSAGPVGRTDSNGRKDEQ